jgi:uncharacterized membrane protein
MKMTLFFIAFALLFAGCGNDQAPADTEETTEAEADEQGPIPGVGFKGLGNDPKWTLEVDFEKEMTFVSTEATGSQTTIVTPTPTAYNLNNPTALRYRGESPEWTLIVTILPFGCQDSETGENYDYQLILRVVSKTTPYEETFQGCGGYQNGYTFEGTEFN